MQHTSYFTMSRHFHNNLRIHDKVILDYLISGYFIQSMCNASFWWHFYMNYTLGVHTDLTLNRLLLLYRSILTKFVFSLFEIIHKPQLLSPWGQRSMLTKCTMFSLFKIIYTMINMTMSMSNPVTLNHLIETHIMTRSIEHLVLEKTILTKKCIQNYIIPIKS